MKLPEAKHMIRMEFYGFHRWGTDYNLLTPEQAIFLDIGLAELYHEMFGGEEQGDKSTRSTFNKRGIRPKRHIN